MKARGKTARAGGAERRRGRRRRWRERFAGLPGWASPAAIVLWTLAVHGAFLAASVLARAPVGAFFYGDSVHYLEEGRRLALGLEPLNAGLPFHPPLTGWLMAPLWWLGGEAAMVNLLAKLTMALLSGVAYAGFYLLVRGRLPAAGPICLLMPLSFGELALASAVSNEVVYRLLLVLLLLVGAGPRAAAAAAPEDADGTGVKGAGAKGAAADGGRAVLGCRPSGWPRPVAAGLLHGLAILTRAEHLLFAAGLAVAGLAVPRWRRFAVLAAPAALAVVLPYVLLEAGDIRAYNQAHAADLPEPLPAVVPVSYYGPLNFALAQREAGIHFSRRTLPPPPGEMAALDPTFPPHNEAIVHGYRLGLAAVAERPGRFLQRTAAKLLHSLRAACSGWTWRDLPKPGSWVRQPVDVAHSPAPWYEATFLALVLLGAWSLRRERWLLAVGGLLLLYRLGVNAVFFPYLRGMLVVSPFYLALFWSGLRPVLGRWQRGVVTVTLVFLALFHFLTVGGDHRYGIAGERTGDGRIIDDRPVVLELRDER